MIKDVYRVTSTDDLPELSVAADDPADLQAQVQAHVDFHRNRPADPDEAQRPRQVVDLKVPPAGWGTVGRNDPPSREGHDGTGTIFTQVGKKKTLVAKLTATWVRYRNDDGAGA